MVNNDQVCKRIQSKKRMQRYAEVCKCALKVRKNALSIRKAHAMICKSGQ